MCATCTTSSPGCSPGGIRCCRRSAIAASSAQPTDRPARSRTAPPANSTSPAATPRRCAPIRHSLRFSSAAAPCTASPSTIAIRLPTGLCEGIPVSESARTTMTESGSRPSSLAASAATMVSWPCPAEEIEMITVISPSASTRRRQPSGKVVLSLAGFMMFSKIALPPLGSRQAATPIPASFPAARSSSRRRSSAASPGRPGAEARATAWSSTAG